MAEFTREETPTIMDGKVVRWQRGYEEISASRNKVCIDCSIYGDEDAEKVIATIRAAVSEAQSLAAGNRFANWKDRP